MVRGLDLFRERFRPFQGMLTLIGGAACDEWFATNGMSFRATDDLDLVVMMDEVNQPYPEIRQTLSDQSPMVKLLPPIRQTLSGEFRPLPTRGSLSRELPAPLEPAQLLRLSWSQLQRQIGIRERAKVAEASRLNSKKDQMRDASLP